MKNTSKCPYCPRSFADANAVFQHANKKHRGEKGLNKLKPASDREPSLAELHVNYLMGDDSAYEPWMDGCENDRIG